MKAKEKKDVETYLQSVRHLLPEAVIYARNMNGV
jgi:hypothetical protein